MIGIVNYGLGNILAFVNIYNKLNVRCMVASSPEDLQAAKKIILPGVGSFDWAMSRLNQSGLRESLDSLVLDSGVPVIGVCVGMQMMANGSEEGALDGLGWIDGQVKRFDETRFRQATHLPHMGWSEVNPVTGDALFRGLDGGGRFYFLHSYYLLPNEDQHVLAETDYGGLFASAANRENIYGVQFHPEKSHHWGVQLLKNFAELC